MNEAIKSLNLADDTIAKRVLQIQRLAYRIEADLIGFDAIPPLHETLDELCASHESFLGFHVDAVLVGVLSYAVDDNTLDIGRLVVHPHYFRRGIGQNLVRYVESVANVETVIVSTGALNDPARRLYERLGYQLVEEKAVVEGLVIACYEKKLL